MTKTVSLARPLRKGSVRSGVNASMAALWVILFLLVASSCRSTIATSEDATLQERIIDNLHGDHLDMITVVVNEGRATLGGTASSAAGRELAQRDAEQVEGVKAVVNNVRVEAP